MYLIDKDKKTVSSINKETFTQLGFSERYDLQEWIVNTPEMLGERLLIIQKEFSEFDDTNERLDLLALDEKGNIVIIENKLDDSGRDVTWQALKYVSYCSKLVIDDIISIYQKYLFNKGVSESAEDNIKEFYNIPSIDEIEINKGEQRIILVAANFRKEVTSTVMWLLEHNISIKCIKVLPYKHNGDILLDVEQIIPIKEVEDYIIGIAKQKQQSIKLNSQKINREIFLSNLTENGRILFSLLFDFADSNDLFLRWGTKGFSLNIKTEGKSSLLGICYGYLPNSIYKQTIYTGFEAINKKVENSDKILEFYKNKIKDTTNFELGGKDYKWLINEKSAIEEMNNFIEILKEVIEKVERTLI